MKRLTGIALVILIFSVSGILFYFFQPNWFKSGHNNNQGNTGLIASDTAAQTVTTTADVCPDCVRRPLDGQMVKPDLANQRPFAVMIDNLSAARPQFGLSAASLVYEAPAEGGVTRYLAVFSPDQAPSEIGPVRSARPYFLAWAEELGATYVHVGGSPAALTAAKNWGKSNLDEFTNGSYFWRTSERTAPHNVLTSGENLNRYRTDQSESGPALNPWLFKDATASSTAATSTLTIKYTYNYKISWKYNPQDNTYYRYLGTKAYQDKSGQAISAKNVIVHVVPFASLNDDKGRLQMSGATSGKAILCQDGICQKGTWEKTADSRTRYYDINSNEMTFNAGITWIQVVDSLTKASY